MTYKEVVFSDGDPSDLDELIRTFHGEWITVRHAVERFKIHPVLERYGEWAVTDYGLECLTHRYVIPKEMLNDQDWIGHMSAKSGIGMMDFRRALAAAKKYYAD